MTAIRDDLDNSAVIGVGISLTFIVVFLFLILQAWYASLNDAETARKSAPPASLANYKAEQAEKLTGYGWVDQDKGQVRIPVERAKALTLKTLSAKPAPAPAPAATEETTESQ